MNRLISKKICSRFWIYCWLYALFTMAWIQKKGVVPLCGKLPFSRTKFPPNCDSCHIALHSGKFSLTSWVALWEVQGRMLERGNQKVLLYVQKSTTHCSESKPIFSTKSICFTSVCSTIMLQNVTSQLNCNSTQNNFLMNLINPGKHTLLGKNC